MQCLNIKACVSCESGDIGRVERPIRTILPDLVGVQLFNGLGQVDSIRTHSTKPLAFPQCLVPGIDHTANLGSERRSGQDCSGFQLLHASCKALLELAGI